MLAIQSLQWCSDHLRILDQRALPAAEHYIRCYTSAAVVDAIRDMAVRGAPAIGIAAAYGMALAARGGENLDTARTQLAAARPTAVNLHAALKRVAIALKNANANSEMPDVLLMLAQQIQIEDLALNQKLVDFGADYVGNARGIFTHCNTGSLATAGLGTALGVIYRLHQRGAVQQVFVPETRPWLQGARLTAWELQQLKIPFHLVCDSSAAHFMRSENIDWLIVGADCIAGNGDTANKIGTYQLAVVAKQHGVKVMVVAPRSSFNLDISSGAEIIIEERPTREVSHIQGVAIAPANCPIRNPAFDVTPAQLIDVLVCEYGIINMHTTTPRDFFAAL